MPLRLTNLELPIEAPEESLKDKIAKRLGIRAEEVARFRILRKSLDARVRESLRFVYTVFVETLLEPGGESRWKNVPGVETFAAPVFDEPAFGEQTLEQRPVVVG